MQKDYQVRGKPFSLSEFEQYDVKFKEVIQLETPYQIFLHGLPHGAQNSEFMTSEELEQILSDRQENKIATAVHKKNVRVEEKDKDGDTSFKHELVERVQDLTAPQLEQLDLNKEYNRVLQKYREAYLRLKISNIAEVLKTPRILGFWVFYS